MLHAATQSLRPLAVRAFSFFSLAPLLTACLLGLAPAAAQAQTVVGTLSSPGLVPGVVRVDESRNLVLVGDGASDKIFFFDGATNAEIGSVATGLPSVGDLLIDAVRGTIWATCGCQTSPNLVVIDIPGRTVQQTIPLPAPGTFAQLAKDEALGRIYAIAVNGFYAIDATTFAVTTVPGPWINLYSSIAVNPVTHEVFTNDGLTSLYIINGQTLELTTIDVTVLESILSMTVNTVENKVYISSDYSDDVWLFDRNTNGLTRLNLGEYDWFRYNATLNMGFSPRGRVIDGATDAVSHTQIGAYAVDVRSSTGHVYYAHYSFTGVRDAASGFLEVVPVTNPSWSSLQTNIVSVNQSTGRIYVVNDAEALSYVTVIQDEDRLTRPPIYAATQDGFKTHMLDPVTRQIGVTQSPTYGLYGLAVKPGGGRVYDTTYGRFEYGGTVETFEGLLGLTSSWFLRGPAGGYPVGIAVTPDGSGVYVARSTTSEVVLQNAATLEVQHTFSGGTTPWGLALSSDGGKLFVAYRGSNKVSVYETVTHTRIAEYPVGALPRAVALHPAGTKAYVANGGAGTVTVIDTISDTILGTIPVGSQPYWIAMTPGGRTAYVSNRGSGTVSVISTETDSVIQTVTVGNTPESLVATPDGSEVWVATITSGAAQIVVIDTSDYSTSAFPLPAPSFGTETMVALATADPTSRFAGRVTNGRDGLPIGGALVRALQGWQEESSAITDAAGQWAIFDLEPGTYDIAVSAAGYVPQAFPAVAVGGGRTEVRHAVLQAAAAGVAVRADFTGDQTSDLLWRGPGGDLWLWGVENATHASDAYVGIVADSNWEIRGQGDLNGDGMADLLWRHKLDGTIYYWQMNGPTPAAQVYVSTVDVSYDIAGTGDFDGDGKADILWRNPAVGDLWLWRMNGAEVLGQAYVDTVDLSYAIKGLGDVNGDAKVDVVWQGASGDLWAWLMNGAIKEAQPYVGTVADASYQLQQVADFDADLKADLLWWNTVQGDVWIWRMNGAEVLSEHYVGVVADTNYRIQAAGDYNGDGKADILWRNIVAGDLWVWIMNGPVKASEAYLGVVADTGYQVVR